MLQLVSWAMPSGAVPRSWSQVSYSSRLQPLAAPPVGHLSMGAAVGEFDLQMPKAIWSVDGYTQAVVLFRNGGNPIGWFPLPTRHASVLTIDDLRQVVEDSE